jgi:hypothetical protein
MKIRVPGSWVILCAAILLLAACANPVPPEKAAYVGSWSGPGMSLMILQDGSVTYRRIKGGVTTSINGPLKKFEGDNFVVGIAFFTTTFVVSRPPHQDAGRWKMTVDGVELTRAAGASWDQPASTP